MSRHRRLLAILIATIAALAVATPAVAGKPPTTDGEYCYDVSFTSDIPAPPPGKVAVQTYHLDANCKVVADPVVTMNATDAPAAFSDASIQIGAAGANTR